MMAYCRERLKQEDNGKELEVDIKCNQDLTEPVYLINESF